MNPCNNGSYHGWLLKEPTYITNREGIAFQARFVLKVKRDYRGKDGKYEYDYIPMRICGESRMKLAKMMNAGDALAICGSVKTGRYDIDGKSCFEVYINVDSISFSPRTSPFFEKEEQQEQQACKIEKPVQENKPKESYLSEFNLPFY